MDVGTAPVVRKQSPELQSLVSGMWWRSDSPADTIMSGKAQSSWQENHCNRTPIRQPTASLVKAIIQIRWQDNTGMLRSAMRSTTAAVILRVTDHPDDSPHQKPTPKSLLWNQKQKLLNLLTSQGKYTHLIESGSDHATGCIQTFIVNVPGNLNSVKQTETVNES